KGGRSKEGDRLQKQIAALQQQIDQYRSRIKQQMMGESQSAPNQDLQALTKEFQISAGMLSHQMEALDKDITEKTEKVMAKSEQSVELDVKSAELDQLQEIARDMSIKLESLDVEASAPARIRLLQPATITSDINSTKRLAIAGAGGLMGFALTLFGISYLEF